MNWNDIFEYRDGGLYWKVSKGRRKAGNEAGCINNCGYKVIIISGKICLAHRIIYEMFNGPIECGYEIDHIDHNKLNNSIENLRLVTDVENKRNRPKQINNTSEVTGVDYRKKVGKWRARIKLHGKLIELGEFHNFDEAVKVRKEAELLYNFHENHGK